MVPKISNNQIAICRIALSHTEFIVNLFLFLGIIESGIATIRRNPSKLNRLGSIGSNVRIPVIPSSPAKPPLPPKRQGSTLSSN